LVQKAGEKKEPCAILDKGRKKRKSRAVFAEGKKKKKRKDDGSIRGPQERGRRGDCPFPPKEGEEEEVVWSST